MDDSTRVSNELGEGNTKQAKHAMNVSLKLSILLAGIVLIGLAFGHDIWPSLFSNIPNITKAFASMTPLLCCSIFLDAIQGVLSGPTYIFYILFCIFFFYTLFIYLIWLHINGLIFSLLILFIHLFSVFISYTHIAYIYLLFFLIY